MYTVPVGATISASTRPSTGAPGPSWPLAVALTTARLVRARTVHGVEGAADHQGARVVRERAHRGVGRWPRWCRSTAPGRRWWHSAGRRASRAEPFSPVKSPPTKSPTPGTNSSARTGPPSAVAVNAGSRSPLGSRCARRTRGCGVPPLTASTKLPPTIPAAGAVRLDRQDIAVELGRRSGQARGGVHRQHAGGDVAFGGDAAEVAADVEHVPEPGRGVDVAADAPAGAGDGGNRLAMSARGRGPGGGDDDETEQRAQAGGGERMSIPPSTGQRPPSRAPDGVGAKHSVWTSWNYGKIAGFTTLRSDSHLHAS